MSTLSVAPLDNLLANQQPRAACQARGIYILFKDSEIVYIGQSKNIDSRLSGHYAEKTKEFNAFTFIPFVGSDDALTDLEAAYIVTYTPVYNRNIPPNNYWIALDEIYVQLFVLPGQRLSKAHLAKQLADAGLTLTNGHYILAAVRELFPSLVTKTQRKKLQREERRHGG